MWKKKVEKSSSSVKSRIKMKVVGQRFRSSGRALEGRTKNEPIAVTAFFPFMYPSKDWKAGKVCILARVEGRVWNMVMWPLVEGRERIEESAAEGKSRRVQKETNDEPKVDEDLFRVCRMSWLDQVELVCDIPGDWEVTGDLMSSIVAGREERNEAHIDARS